LDLWDYLVLAAIGLLLTFTPLASGGVEVWATSVAEGICFGLALLWLGKCFLGASGFPTLARREFRAMVLASGAFVALLLFQITPLPPPLLKALSPHSYELYRNSLPGWPGATVYADPSYTRPPPAQKHPRMVAVLPTVEEVQSGVAVPFAPRAGAVAKTDPLPLAVSVWRPLSVAPVLTRAGLLKCAAYAALFLAVIFYRPGRGDVHAERRFRRIVLITVLASGAVVAVTGLIEQARFHGSPGSAFAARASGPFVNPDHFANYLAMVLPLAAAGALYRVPLDPLRERLSGFQLLCGAIALLIAAAIVLSLSRAGWIEIGLGIALFAWMLRSRLGEGTARESEAQRPETGRSAAAWFLPVGAAIIVIAMAALAMVGTGGREQAGARMAESLSGGVGFWERVDTWIDSAQILRDYPVFGSGSDSWAVVFPHYQRPPWTMYFKGEAHNDYVEVAAECGLAGMIVLGWLAWEIRRWFKEGVSWIPSRHWPLFAALIAALGIMAFHETLDFCMQIPANAVLMVLLIAMALRLVRTHMSALLGREPRAAARFAVPALIGIAATAGLAGAAYQKETVYPNDLRYPASIHANLGAILAHPASPFPHLWLADRVHNATGVWLKGELEAAIWLDPLNPAGRDRYVQALLSEERHGEALREITKAVYLAPKLGEHGYLNARIIPWLTREEQAAAVRGLREAMASGFAGTTTELAQLYVAQGHPAEAARLYEEAARKQRDASHRFDDMMAAAAAYAQAGKRQKAEKLLLDAARMAPADPRPYADLIAWIYAPGHNSAAAAAIIRTAASSGVDTAPLYLALQNAAQTSGDAQMAEAALRSAVKADPSFDNWMRLGGFYLDAHNYERAGDAIRRALRLNASSGWAYYMLAQSEEGTYQYPAAQADYQRAIALAPDNAEFKSRSLDLRRKIAQDRNSSAALSGN
jgi:tetratricopeptide (TPR) repeat protein